MDVILYMYRTASLLRPARCYAPLPPIFGRNYCIGLFYLHYTPPPPAGRSSRFAVLTAVLHVYACCKCRRVVFVYQAYRWVLAFFADLGRFPEAVILPSRPVGGVWLRDYLLCFATCTWPTTLHPSVLPRHVDRRSSRLLPQYRVREFVGGGGGLNCEAKAQVLVVTPPPPLFPESRSQKGEA